MKYAVIVSVVVGLLAGCFGITPAMKAEMAPVDQNAQKEFTYDFSLPGKSQADLWRSARDFFAETYGDSRAVFRVEDEKDGTLIGRGLAPWALMSTRCISEYQIRFAAKVGKARLQYELIEGAPALSQCQGWLLPSKSGYKEITDSFAKSAKSLELALQGKGSGSKLKDF